MIKLHTVVTDWETRLEHWMETEASQVKEEMEFDYGENELWKDGLVPALTLAKFVHNNNYADWEAKRPVLHNLVDSPDRLLATVAMLECMPDTMFRHVLWKYNIDFISIESFLRRLSESQMKGIERSYKELFEHNRVPSIFGLFHRIFKRLNPSKLLGEESDKNTRYERKAAWSYNLLGIDFGFNAYPKGTENDFKLANVSPLRFLSIKNHVDDFVVNQESGKYWFMYRTARTFLGMWSSANVRLKSHICPGFWITFIFHIMFWIVSPLALMSFPEVATRIMESNMNSFTAFVAFIPLVLASAMIPLWILGKFFNGIYSLIKLILPENFFSKCRDSINGFFSRHDDLFCAVWVLFIILIVFTLICVGAYYLFFLLYPAFGTVWTVIIQLMIFSYTIAHIMNGGDNSFNDFYFLHKLFIGLVVFYLCARFFADSEWLISAIVSGISEFARHIVFGFSFVGDIIVNYSKAVWGMLKVLGWLLIFFLIPFLLISATFSSLFLSEKNFEKVFKYTLYFFKAFIALILFLVPARIIYLIYFSEAEFGKYYSSSETISLGILLCLIFFTWIYFSRADPSYVQSKEAIKLSKEYSNVELNLWCGSPKPLMKNKWYQAQSKKAKQQIVTDMMLLCGNLFGAKNAYLGYHALAPGVSKERLKMLFIKKDWLAKQEKDLQLEMLRLVARGELCNKKVLKKARAIVMARRQRNKIVKGLFLVIFWPFNAVGSIIVYLAKKLWKICVEIPVGFYQLYKLFNERCPFVTQSGKIKM